MQSDYWRQRWDEGRVGWHQPEVNGLLKRHWAGMELPEASRVFVPLCGKSLDLAWLADQGHRVLGVELSAAACETFFASHALTPEVSERGHFRCYRAGNIELWAGDVFDLVAEDLVECAACYDRAALVALPPELRRRFASETYGKLPAGCRSLLITLEFPAGEKPGPPFSVEEAEVHRLFEPAWRVSLQEKRDILGHEPKFQEAGVCRLHTAAYRLRKQSRA